MTPEILFLKSYRNDRSYGKAWRHKNFNWSTMSCPGKRIRLNNTFSETAGLQGTTATRRSKALGGNHILRSRWETMKPGILYEGGTSSWAELHRNDDVIAQRQCTAVVQPFCNCPRKSLISQIGPFPTHCFRLLILTPGQSSLFITGTIKKSHDI